MATAAVVVCLIVPVLWVSAAGAQGASGGGVTAQDISVRDQLIADQESLLNVYRCVYQIDVGAVPGGCSGTEPAQGRTQPGTFQGTPTEVDLEVRDQLIANQEALPNVYRCQFNVDTQLVPGGCDSGHADTGQGNQGIGASGSTLQQIATSVSLSAGDFLSVMTGEVLLGQSI